MGNQTSCKELPPDFGQEVETAGYCAEVPMTFEERVRMYMNCEKIDLARMLAERDMHPPHPYPMYAYPPEKKDDGTYEYEIYCSSASTISIA